MSAVEPLTPSRRLRSAAGAERDRLTRELHKLDTRAEALQTALATVERHRTELREHLALLARLTWEPEESAFAIPTTRPTTHLKAVESDGPPPKHLLRGAKIRETAVLLLASSANPTRPIHYQQWYQLLRDADYGVDARDPKAAFLTQITRSPVVRRTDAPGVYALDLDAPQRLRRQVSELEAMLTTRTGPHADLDDLTRARNDRAKVVRMLRAAERELDETLRSLGSTPPQPIK